MAHRSKSKTANNVLSRRKIQWGVGAALLLVVTMFGSWWWFRPPAIGYANLKYVQLLHTAVSSRNPEWVSGVRRALEHRKSHGEISEAEFQALSGIVAVAEAQRWDEAEAECIRLEKAQAYRRRSDRPEDDEAHEHGPRAVAPPAVASVPQNPQSAAFANRRRLPRVPHPPTR